MITVFIIMVVMFLVVCVPLTVAHVQDMKKLKMAERELKLLDRIEEIEKKYGVTISDEDLEMR